MKRLEYICTLRRQMNRRQAKTPDGARIVLVQTAREKQRLRQELHHWQATVRKIEKRLKEIEELEEQLLAVANFRAPSAQGQQPGQLAGNLPPGFTEVTVRY